MRQTRVGISGWTYAPWRGVFFPRGLPQKDELAYAARQVNSIEINGTFYSLQKPSSYAAWAAQTPDDFLFAVKGPRFITHVRRLRDAELPLANFFASGPLRLGRKLGPFLWQLPPSLRYDPERLEAFLKLLPRDWRGAAALARRHDGHVKDTWFEAKGNRRLQHALEVRHVSFETPAFIRQLRRHRIGLVVADTAGKWPLLEDVTADFVYIRLHGDERIYVSGYTPAALRRWAGKIEAWRAGATPPGTRTLGPASKAARGGRDIYVYFDNDVKTRAPFDAISLARRLRLPPPRQTNERKNDEHGSEGKKSGYSGDRRLRTGRTRGAPGGAGQGGRRNPDRLSEGR